MTIKKNQKMFFPKLKKNKIIIAQDEVESYFRNIDLSKTKTPNLIRGYLNQNEFPFPKLISDYLIKKIKSKELGYQPRIGPKHLREIISFYENIKFPANYDKNDIILTHGSLDGIERVTQLFNRKSEFIVSLPTYGDIIKSVLTKKGKLVTILTKRQDNFNITANAISQLSY